MSTVSTRRYSSNTTADPVGLDASPGGWKWARSDATPSVRCCYQAGTYGYLRLLKLVRRRVEGRASRRSAVGALHATSRAYTYKRIHVCPARAIAVHVQVVFDLQTLFLLSGVVTQARIIRCSTHTRTAKDGERTPRTHANTL